jgi:hypothetical protein
VRRSASITRSPITQDRSRPWNTMGIFKHPSCSSKPIPECHARTMAQALVQALVRALVRRWYGRGWTKGQAHQGPRPKTGGRTFAVRVRRISRHSAANPSAFGSPAVHESSTKPRQSAPRRRMRKPCPGFCRKALPSRKIAATRWQNSAGFRTLSLWGPGARCPTCLRPTQTATQTATPPDPA